VRFSLYRVRINQAGYTDRGEYYGNSVLSLYRFADEETGDYYGEFRALDRNDAREVLRARYPNATFYN
jgi:hypothetical protein